MRDPSPGERSLLPQEEEPRDQTLGSSARSRVPPTGQPNTSHLTAQGSIPGFFFLQEQASFPMAGASKPVEAGFFLYG